MAHNPRVGIDKKLVEKKDDEIKGLKEKGVALKREVNQREAEEEGRKHCYQY